MTNAMRHFIIGMGSSIDLAGVSGVRSRSGVGDGLHLDRTDAQALSHDWKKLAEDFGAAFVKTTHNADGAHVEPE